MVEKRICDKCLKDIGLKDDHYVLIEVSNGKEISRKFMHKSCQNLYDDSMKRSAKLENETFKVLQMSKDLMKKMGAEEVIQI